MDTKEIAISIIVLILLLAGFYFLINVAGSKSSDQGLESGTADIPTTQDLNQTSGLSEGVSEGLEVENLNSNKNVTPDQEEENERENNMKNQKPEMQLKDGVDYQALVKTSMGNIKLDLFEDLAPITVNNFIYLAQSGFYDGLIFHRVMDDFMIQGGDPTGTGSGGPGYSFADEINNKKLVKGSLAMANAGPNTNGSQFFIVTKEATPWLDGLHTNFGQVLEGQGVADAISKVAVDGNSRPLEKIIIETIQVIEN